MFTVPVCFSNMLLWAIIFQIIATAHIELQTANILSVLTLKLQISDNMLQNQVVQLRLEDEASGAATFAVNVIWVVEDLLWLTVAMTFIFYSLAHTLKG